jgi:hypothetical protein
VGCAVGHHRAKVKEREVREQAAAQQQSPAQQQAPAQRTAPSAPH